MAAHFPKSSKTYFGAPVESHFNDLKNRVCASVASPNTQLDDLLKTLIQSLEGIMKPAAVKIYGLDNSKEEVNISK